MGPSYCLRGVLLTLIISLAFPKCAHAQNATEHEIIWQFQRDGGIRLYGDTLERQLGTINMVVGDTLRFSWGGFGELHGLYQTESDTEFNTCSTGSGSVLAVNIQASIVVSPEAGTFYFFDHISENCAEGLLRIQVNVFSQADFVPDTTTPAASVVETTQNPENAVVVDWQPGTDFDLVDVSEDEGVRFVWSSTAQFVVTQVTEQSFNDCDMRSGILRRYYGIYAHAIMCYSVTLWFFIAIDIETCCSTCKDAFMHTVRVLACDAPPDKNLWDSVV
eukprot:m.826059 g.826059  ORF g.826059 m.826059 type:complete len:276 (+) comp23410_c0_seq7:261-1088(+)